MSGTIPGVLILQAFARTGDSVTNPPQTDPSGFVNWTNGYTPFYEISLAAGNPAAKAVERGVQNGLFNLLTANQINWQQLGFAQWFSSMPGGYSQNAMVFRWDGTSKWLPYRSLVDTNSADPLSSPTSWEYIPYGHEMLANVPMPSGGPSGSSAEVVTSATDFNTFTTGTWQFQTDAIANGSPNAPTASGSTTLAGMLESLKWNGLSGATFVVQRYSDRQGNLFTRGATSGVWAPWLSDSSATQFSTDVSVTAGIVKATFPMASATLADNEIFWVKIANTNPGTGTFTPNASIIPTPLPIVGPANLALQGGEMVVGGRAMFIYKADTNNFILEFCSGGNVQVPTATQTNQAVNLAQLLAAIAGVVPRYVNAANNGQTLTQGSYNVDTSPSSGGGAFTMNIPATLTVGEPFTFTDMKGTWAQNSFTINPGAFTINGNAGSLVCNTRGLSFSLVYDGTTLEMQ